MKTFTYLSVCLLASCILITGCSDSDEQKTEYKNLTWLYVTTRDAYYNSVLSHSREDEIGLIFYGEPASILTLLNAEITIFSISAPSIFFGEFTESGFLSKSTLTITDIYRYPLNLADCANNNSFQVYLNPLTLTENKEYEFYFQIKNPDRGIYYQTPTYRLTLTSNRPETTDWFTTDIEILP